MKGWFIILCFVTSFVGAQPEQVDPLQQSFEENKAATPTQQTSYSMNDEENSIHDDPMQLTSMILDEQKIMFLITCIATITSLYLGIAIVHSRHEKRKIYRSLNNIEVSMSVKHEEIRRQANKLAEAYANIWKTNQHLKEEVNLCTEKILVLNKKLIEYSTFNSHKLRGPVASFLGLISLIQTEEINDSVKEMLQMLNTSANELDSIVQEFTRRLDSEL